MWIKPSCSFKWVRLHLICTNGFNVSKEMFFIAKKHWLFHSSGSSSLVLSFFSLPSIYVLHLHVFAARIQDTSIIQTKNIAPAFRAQSGASKRYCYSEQSLLIKKASASYFLLTDGSVVVMDL